MRGSQAILKALVVLAASVVLTQALPSVSTADSNQVALHCENMDFGIQLQRSLHKLPRPDLEDLTTSVAPSGTREYLHKIILISGGRLGVTVWKGSGYLNRKDDPNGGWFVKWLKPYVTELSYKWRGPGSRFDWNLSRENLSLKGELQWVDEIEGERGTNSEFWMCKMVDYEATESHINQRRRSYKKNFELKQRNRVKKRKF
jgi:hypothetical protein